MMTVSGAHRAVLVRKRTALSKRGSFAARSSAITGSPREQPCSPTCEARPRSEAPPDRSPPAIPTPARRSSLIAVRPATPRSHAGVDAQRPSQRWPTASSSTHCKSSLAERTLAQLGDERLLLGPPAQLLLGPLALGDVPEVDDEAVARRIGVDVEPARARLVAGLEDGGQPLARDRAQVGLDLRC